MRNQDPGQRKVNLKRKVSNMVFIVPLFMLVEFTVVESKEGIEDRTEANLVNLRGIMNALNYEEAVHKLLKIELQEGQEVRNFFGFLFCRRKTNHPF